MSRVTIRIPTSWSGRVDTRRVKDWLGGFLRKPRALPPDPGSGPERVCLSIPARALKALEVVTNESRSVGLRRLMASQLPVVPVASASVPLLAPVKVAHSVAARRLSPSFAAGGGAEAPLVPRRVQPSLALSRAAASVAEYDDSSVIEPWSPVEQSGGLMLMPESPLFAVGRLDRGLNLPSESDSLELDGFAWRALNWVVPALTVAGLLWLLFPRPSAAVPVAVAVAGAAARAVAVFPAFNEWTPVR